MKDSLIIYSGGLDSTVLLHHYKKDIALAVSFNYGSKHNDQEIAHAILNTKELSIEHLIIDLRSIFLYFQSDLLKSGGVIPKGHYEDVTMKKTVVPFRNGIFLSIAAGIAESRNLTNIALANHAGDHAIYPDCRPDFIHHMKRAIKHGTINTINIIAPFTTINKRAIAQLGNRVNVDFTKTYSCYVGGEIHCGTCGTCTERKEALKGFDPTEYIE